MWVWVLVWVWVWVWVWKMPIIWINFRVIFSRTSRFMANLVSRNGRFQPIFRMIVLKSHEKPGP